MAIREEVNFSEYTTNINVAVNQTTIFARASEEAEDKSRNFGQTLTKFGNDVLKTESVMKSLNEHTHGYATKVKEVVDVTKLFISEQKAAAYVQGFFNAIVGTSAGTLKLFRMALAGTGVGAIVLAIGYLIGNFEKVKNAVLNFIPGLSILGDIFGGMINWVTDFVGATSDASRALDELEEQAQEGLRRDELAFESNSDQYDEFTKRKIKASLDYRNKVGEINREEKLSVEEKEQAIADAHARMLREINQADKDSKAELNGFLEGYRKKQEEDDADTAIKRIALEEKRALAELDRMKATEAQKKAIRDYYQGKINDEQANIDAEEKRKAAEKVKAAREQARQRSEAVKKILEDYDKKQKDAAAKSDIDKINLEERRARDELKRLGAKKDQEAKIIAYYDGLRTQALEKSKDEELKIQKEKDSALNALSLTKKTWEIDNKTDVFERLAEQRKFLEEQSALEIKKLESDIMNAQLSSKERADAEIRLETVRQELEKGRKENDNQKAEADKTAEENKKKEDEAKLKRDEELAQKRMDFGYRASSYLAELTHKQTEGDDKRTDEEIERDRAKAQNQINLAGNTAKMLADMGGKGAEFAKGVAVSQAIQDTYKGANAAYSSMATIPVVGPALGVAAAGVAVASGLMNVKKILATKPVEKSAPGGGGGGAGAAPAAPSFNLVQGTGANQIAEAIGGQNTPIQAYVVSSNVTSAQSLDRNIVEQSSL